MLKAGRIIVSTTLLLLVSIAVRPAIATPVETIPIEQIQPGMVGEGRTVFEGTTIETFKVTILGVLRNFGPKRDMILAELEGGPLAHTGVIAGMSGSPVYIDGKLIGAVAYAFPFAKDPIAGITPIEEMIDATATPARRRSAAKLEFPLTPEKVAAAAPARPRPVAIQGMSLTGVDRLQPYIGKQIAPIATPASVAGFPAESFEVLAPLLRQLGLEPLMGGGVAAGVQSVAGPEPEAAPTSASLAPGDAVGVGLVTGDLQISATGTVTHVDELTGAVYAFGHPLFNLGPIEYPMTEADIQVVLPSVMNSFKMSSTGDTIGTWMQDRATAIKGVLNSRPRMIPLAVHVKTSRQQERNYSMEIVNDELFSPVLAFASLVSILQSIEREFGSQTVKVSARIETADERRIRIEDIFTGDQAAIASSAMVAAPIAFLMGNDFQDVVLEEIQVEVEATETPLTARLIRAWLDTDEVSPGGTVTLKILLKSYRGDEMLETADLTIPANIRSGQLRLTVADANVISALERRQARDSFVPRDMDQLVRAINTLRKNNRLYVRLSRMDRGGGIVAGEYLTSLPPSVMNVLEGDRSANGFTAVQDSTIWEQELPTEYSVSGAQVLQLEVKNR